MDSIFLIKLSFSIDFPHHFPRVLARTRHSRRRAWPADRGVSGRHGGVCASRVVFRPVGSRASPDPPRLGRWQDVSTASAGDARLPRRRRPAGARGQRRLRRTRSLHAALGSSCGPGWFPAPGSRSSPRARPSGHSALGLGLLSSDLSSLHGRLRGQPRAPGPCPPSPAGRRCGGPGAVPAATPQSGAGAHVPLHGGEAQPAPRASRPPRGLCSSRRLVSASHSAADLPSASDEGRLCRTRIALGVLRGNAGTEVAGHTR